MAQNLANFLSILGDLTWGIGDKLAQMFANGLIEWSRKAEFSADRAGLLLVQNRDDALRALGKIAVGSHKISNRLNLDELLEQAKEFEELDAGLSRQFWKLLIPMEQALKDYNKSIQLEPSNDLVYYNRGIVRYDLGDKEGAVEDYNRAIALNPTLTLAYYNRGIARYYLSNYREALEDFDLAISLDRDFANAYYNRGNLRARLKDTEGAIVDLKKAAELYQKQGNDGDYRGAIERISSLRDKAA
jgi:tetratricopeptide (TPR) repeat protein